MDEKITEHGYQEADSGVVDLDVEKYIKERCENQVTETEVKK